MNRTFEFFCKATLCVTTVIVISACGSSKTSSDPVINYHCSDGSEVRISFSGEKAYLTGTLNGKTYDLDLPHVESGSGARYSKDSVTVWGKGKDMTIEAGGITYNCTEAKTN